MYHFFRNKLNLFQAQLTVSIPGSDVLITLGNIANGVEHLIYYQNIPYFTPAGTPQAKVSPPDTV